MVIIISYNKQTWNEYNDSQTTQENLANGGIISADRLNHMEDGIGNNDTNKVTDNKNGTIEVNGSSITPADDSTVLHNNALNQILTDNSGIIIGNDKDFGFIKRQNYKGGLAIGANNSFHFMATNDSALSNTSEYHDVWNIGSDGKVSILGGASFTPSDDSKVVHNSGNEEIGGQKTFDTAPIDKTTGNPYITKSDIPKDAVINVVTQAQYDALIDKTGLYVIQG